MSVSCESEGQPAVEGLGRDLSVGGMFIESGATLAFNTKLTIVCRIPGMDADSRLPAIVRWAKPGGFGVQFGMLGARETHAITRLMRG